MKKRLAVFAHYDRDNVIDDYVMYYLEELKKVASDIVFVSDCDLPDAELKKLDGIVKKSIAMRHGEYDFGSYKRGYQAMEKDLDKYDELIFANDSCYGPFYPLKDVWKTMDQKVCDFWGLFEHRDSEVKKWYLQSYFFVFKKNVFVSKGFKKFINSIKKEERKRDIVIKYEMRLSNYLVSEGFKYDSLFKKSKKNLTHQNKVFNMIKKGLPFLKRHLFEVNIYKVSKVNMRKEKLDNFLKDKYPVQLMNKHIKRMLKEKNTDHLYYVLSDFKKEIFHRKFIRIYFSNKKYWYGFGLKIFGVTLIKFPIWFNWKLWLQNKKRK